MILDAMHVDMKRGHRTLDDERLGHATLDALHAVSDTAAEHGRRATRPRDPRSRPHECPRQDRGEVRAPQPRSHVDPRVTSIIVHLPEPAGLSLRMGASASRPSEASTTTGRLTTAGACAHATRAAASAPLRRRQTRHAPRRPQRRRREPRTPYIGPLPSFLLEMLRATVAQTHELATLDALPGSSRASGRSVTGRSIIGTRSHGARCNARSGRHACRARSPSNSTS